MIGTKIRSKKRRPAEWVAGLLRSEFFGSCVNHEDLRKNERNLFCIDCNICLCKHCANSSDHDCPQYRLLQICKYVYHDVVRLQDIQKHLDCSKIQSYKINGEKAVHLNPRPQLKDAKNSKAKGGAGAYCEACGRHLQDMPNRFCSIACKVSMDAETNVNKTNKRISVPISEVEHLPSFGLQSTNENGYDDSLVSLTESLDVIDHSWVSSSLRPKKVYWHKRKGLPRRAPLR